MIRPCPGADRAFSPRFRDDEAPTEDEPTDAPDHTDVLPLAADRDRAASLEVVAAYALTQAVAVAVLFCVHLSRVWFPVTP